MNLQFIVNPLAGRGKCKRIVRCLHRTLSDCPSLHYEVNIPRYKGEATLIAKKAADEKSIVVAVGGDGTVNEVVNGIIGTQTILGIIPAGTGNGFARELSLPFHTEEACKVLLDGHIKWIDAGKANGRYFLGTAGLGFDALIARLASETFGPLRGMWLYFFAGLLAFRRHKPQLITIRIDSQVVKICPLLVAVANTGRYGGGALIAPGASPEDGLFDICIIGNMRSWRLLQHLPKLFKGEHTKLPEVNVYKGSRVSIESSVPIPVHVDGEPIESYSEVQFVIIPKAIRVLVPKEGGSPKG